MSKNKNYMMIMMVALVTMLLMIMPVAATSSVVGQSVGPGATIFIGEEKLDITSAMGEYHTIGYWSSGADLDKSSPSNTIEVSGRITTFSVTPAEFSSYTGNWYQIANDGITRKNLAFRVSDPTLTLQIQNKFDTSNVGGKIVTAGTNLGFEINTNIILDNKRWDSTNTTIAPVVTSFVSSIPISSTKGVKFDAKDGVSGSFPMRYTWEFGDGTSESNVASNKNELISNVHPYTGINSTYPVKLIVYNDVNSKSDQIKSSVNQVLEIITTNTINPTSYSSAQTGHLVTNNGCPVFDYDTETGLTVTIINSTSTTGPFAMNGSLVNTLVTHNVPAGSYKLTFIKSSTCSEDVSPVVLTTTYDRTDTSVAGSQVKPMPTSGVNTQGFVNIIVKTASGSTYDRLVNIDPTNPSWLTHLYITQNPYTWNGKWNTSAMNAGQRVYQTGVYTAYAESTLNNMKENYKDGSGAYYTGKTVSTVSTVTIGSNTLKITVNKDSVVRGNDFSVQITGQPSRNYTLFIKGILPSSTTSPVITNFQVGTYDVTNTTATVSTDTSGVRTVGFTTSSNTKDQKYTIRVEENSQKYDEVSVNVVKGGMTLVANGDQSYYIGEEIKLSGTNTETDTTYFFIVGPNLNSNGVSLDGSGKSIINGDESTFESADVDSSDVFTYDWSTSMADLDSGTYTIYGVSKPKDKSHISDAAYATVSVIIKKPYVSATSRGTVAKGDKILITGVAEGQPSSGVAVWVLGKNYATIHTQSIDTDGTYEYEIPGADTNSMSSGQYFVVVQHPMQNDKFDIVPTNYNLRTSGDVFIENLQLSGSGMTIFKIGGSGSLQGSDAAEALIQAISDPNIDDTYTKLTIIVSEPLITISSIGNRHVGDKFNITGKTNLAVDDEILMEIYSSSFKPTQKTQSGEFSGATGTIKVVKGEGGFNAFSFDVDASTFKIDEYLVMAQAVVQDTTGTTLFNVVEGASTTTPVVTPVVTAPIIITVPPTAPPQTVPPTIPPTTIVPTITTESPGFGAVFALIGLGAVAFIVVRRD